MNQTISRSAMVRLPGPQWTGGQLVQWGAPVKREDRKMLRAGLTVAAMGVGLLGAAASFVTTLPLISGLSATPFMAASHVIDRMKNSVVATDEMSYRAKFYSAQIFKTLGVTPRAGQQASVEMFKQAAAINPQLDKLYKAPLREKDKENRTSLLTNGGIIAASSLTGVTGAIAGVADAAKHGIEGVKLFGEASKVAGVAKGAITTVGVLARDGAGALAGGALAKVLSHERIDPHALVEALDKTVSEARMQGIDVREVVSPNLLFALRVAQDEAFSDQLRKQFGKPFHMLDAKTQGDIMNAYPALTQAVKSEASAIEQQILPVAELGASGPNLNSRAQQYAVGKVGSNTVAANDVSIPESNVRSHTARILAERTAARMPTGRQA